MYFQTFAPIQWVDIMIDLCSEDMISDRVTFNLHRKVLKKKYAVLLSLIYQYVEEAVV